MYNNNNNNSNNNLDSLHEMFRWRQIFFRMCWYLVGYLKQRLQLLLVYCDCAGRIWRCVGPESATKEVELQVVWLVSDEYISRTVHSRRCCCIRRSQ